ncbi:hypothetical protein BDW74DRAFT_182991 [Aspergillus multicolor]|uniref:uncharacterized protein n=1 Tax=Aspergillus multicolor TaxID=41759 RepID=UPI003CCDDB1C
MADAEPIPIVLCGRTVEVGSVVSELLRPEYEVIHFCSTAAAVEKEIPLLLSGNDPKPEIVASNEVGTHNYTQPPRAVVFGRGSELDFVKELQSMCRERSRAHVAWVIGDPSKAPAGPPPPGYAQSAADVVKRVLAKWKEDGKDGAFLIY